MLLSKKPLHFLANYHATVVEQIVARYHEHKHAMANLKNLKQNGYFYMKICLLNTDRIE